jgi:hypothetical protein
VTEPAPDPAAPDPTVPDPTVADLARRLGVDVADPAMRSAITDALADAVDDVTGYLGRPIRPVTKVATGCWPLPGARWDIPAESGPIREIVSVEPEFLPDNPAVTSGMFTLTYTVGIDYLTDPETGPIRRYIRAAAMNSPELVTRLAAGGHRGSVANVSVSTEGQSKTVTYAPLSYGGGGPAGTDSPGALPSLTSLDRWRRTGRRVRQAPDLGHDSRLYSGPGVYRDVAGFWNRA